MLEENKYCKYKYRNGREYNNLKDAMVACRKNSRCIAIDDRGCNKKGEIWLCLNFKGVRKRKRSCLYRKASGNFDTQTPF